MNKFRKYLLRLGTWLIRKSGYHVQVMAIDKMLFAAAKVAVAEAERVAAGQKDAGAFKRQQALVVLSNVMPHVPEHDCINAIQVVLEHLRHA